MNNLQAHTKQTDVPRKSLQDHFYRHLDAELAVNDSQRAEAHRLRYDVYCDERGYENPEHFPDRLERDEYDAHSVHALVRHRSTSLVAGVVRLVFADREAPEKPLPIEHHCGECFDHSALERFDFTRAGIAEVSRFAVSDRLIRRLANTSTETDEDPSQYLPHISLGLIAMLFVASAQHRITHWYAVMEPSLNRLLSRSGIDFTSIGPVVNYHGRRQPMIASVNELLSNIRVRRPDFYRLIESLGGLPADCRTEAAQARIPTRIAGHLA